MFTLSFIVPRRVVKVFGKRGHTVFLKPHELSYLHLVTTLLDFALIISKRATGVSMTNQVEVSFYRNYVAKSCI